MYTVSTSGSARAYHHPDLRAALLAAARALLEEGGESALGLRAAARRAGVSAMAPYRHFRDKSALLAAVAASGFDELAAALRAADVAADATAGLAAQGEAYVAFACRHPALFRLMFGALRPERDPALQAAAGAAFAVLTARSREVAGALPAEDVAILAWSLVHGLAQLLIDRRMQADPATVRRVIAAFAQRVVRDVPA